MKVRTLRRKITIEDENRAADELRECRPPVIPGTNVIPDHKAKMDWYAKVDATRQRLFKGRITPPEWLTRAGVPD
jgi:hypothetical protein